MQPALELLSTLGVFSELPSLYPEAEAQSKRLVCEPKLIPQ
jgi:hypothetical protein